MHLRCAACQRTFALGPLFQGCPSCSGRLEVEYDYAALAPGFNAAWADPSRHAVGIWRYAPLLPIDDRTHVVSLGEGQTPLVHSRRIGPLHGLQQLFFKNETVNPTWAQKDRCHTVMLTKAREFGYRRVVTCSTGNHGASAAAYSAAAGLDACAVFCPPETSDLLLRLIDHFGGTALVSEWSVRPRFMHALVERGWYPATGLGAGVDTNPYGVEGYKSLAYELVKQLGEPPAHVFMSVASGDSFYGVWKGFRELHQLGCIEHTPRMWACQPAGADVLARSLAEQLEHPVVLTAPFSVATSTREPTTGSHALNAIRESDGGAVTVDDEAILAATRLLGREGLCGEPASALPLAAILTQVENDTLRKDERVVCVITAAGIKWPSTLADLTRPARRVEPTQAALNQLLVQLDAL